MAEEIASLNQEWLRRVAEIGRVRERLGLPVAERAQDLRTHISVALFVMETGMTPATAESHVNGLIDDYARETERAIVGPNTSWDLRRALARIRGIKLKRS
jgi:hypothetical protein